MKTMDEYKLYLQQKNYAKRTINEHLSVIKNFTIYLYKENLEIAEITYNDVLGYVAIMSNKNLSISTQINRITIIKTYFKHLINKGLIDHNPAIDVKLKIANRNRIQNTLNESDLEVIYDTFINHQDKFSERDKEAHIKHRIVLGLIIYQGLSSNDINRLLITDFNLQQGLLDVSEGSRTKERIIKLEAKQLYLLTTYITTKKGEKLFDGSVRVLLEVITKKLKRILEESVTITQLRTSRIMLWLKYYNIRKVQYLCGFKYLSSLEKYRVNEIEELRRKLEECFGV